MDMLVLQTKEQLDIFVNPQRQRLLRILSQSKEPLTPKELSKRMDISSSSVQYHLKRLESIGLVTLDHTAVIRGIIAKYYAFAPVQVHIGGEGALKEERNAVLKSIVAGELEDSLRAVEAEEPLSDILTGTVHLTQEDARELQRRIRRFLEEKSRPALDAAPFSYALLYCAAGEKQ